MQAPLALPLPTGLTCTYIQIVPVPEIPSDALRQAFIDHGRSMGVELETVPRETPVAEVNTLTLHQPHTHTHAHTHTHSLRTLVSRTSWLSLMMVAMCSLE